MTDQEKGCACGNEKCNKDLNPEYEKQRDQLLSEMENANGYFVSTFNQENNGETTTMTMNMHQCSASNIAHMIVSILENHDDVKATFLVLWLKGMAGERPVETVSTVRG